ncbi:hypothetical protein FOCC_FOCC014602 [Frankliniella occidentalis]|nr:hypothetical protein FOCC_FOCC014602 [Frankliniella occidentalis]
MSSEKRKSTVSIRQVQKRAKQESDAALQNVEVDESWLLGVDVDSAFPDDGAVASSSGSGPASVPCDEEAGDNAVIVTPTDFSQLFPDAAGQESSDEEIDDEEPETLVSRLRRWYVEAKINLKQLGMLLEELRPIHPELPKDPRTVVETPRTTVVKNLSGGGDHGLPLFQSGAEAWPILGRSLDLVDKRPFVIGFYSGSSKPSHIEDYLEDYIQEAKVLLKDGLEFQDEKLLLSFPILPSPFSSSSLLSSSSLSPPLLLLSLSSLSLSLLLLPACGEQNHNSGSAIPEDKEKEVFRETEDSDKSSESEASGASNVKASGHNSEEEKEVDHKMIAADKLLRQYVKPSYLKTLSQYELLNNQKICFNWLRAQEIG